MRLEGASESVHASVPEAYVDAVVAITDLGSPTVMMFLLATVYWLFDRERTVLVIGYAFVGVVLLITIKAVLGMPRPPESAFLIELDGDEYGFPSGHTFAAVIVYGGLLVVFEKTRSLLAVSAVTLLVTLIGLSRVVLGLHYLGDILAGAALGILVLVCLEYLTQSDPRRAFALATVLAFPALIATGVDEYALLGLGGALGGVIASGAVSTLPPLRSKLEGAVVFIAGCTFVLVLEGATGRVLAIADSSGGMLGVAILVGAVGLFAVQVAGILLAPALARWVPATSL